MSQKIKIKKVSILYIKQKKKKKYKALTKPLQYVETQHDQPLGKIKSRNPIKSQQAQPVTQQRWIC